MRTVGDKNRVGIEDGCSQPGHRVMTLPPHPKTVNPYAANPFALLTRNASS